MKRFVRVLPLPLLAVVLLLGCGPTNKDVLGTWSGTLSMSDKGLDDAQRAAKVANGGNEIPKEIIKTLLESSGASLTLKGDGTFEMSFGPTPRSGHWEFHDSKVILKMEKVSGQDPSKVGKKTESDTSATESEDPWTFKLSSDKKTLSGSDPSDPGTTMKLAKK